MKIALNLQPAVTQQAGIGRYTRELATHLLPLLGDETKLRLDFFDFRRDAKIPAALQKHAGLHPVRWIPGGIVQKAWNHLSFPPYDWLHGRADLYHFTNFLAAPCNTGKRVASIHDLSFIRFPQYTEPKNLRYLKKGIQRTASQADAIITISHFSAKEITTFLEIPEDRIFTTHLGVAPCFTKPTPKEIDLFRSRNGITRPYLLTVGTVEPRKNIPFLISLYEHMQDYEGDLLIAGGLGWRYEPILKRMQESPRAKQIRRIGYMPEEDLPALYASADAFLLPSFYEGFGLPPLEAMACQTPVIASSGGSLREVLQDGAIVLDHYDLDLWSEMLTKILGDKTARNDLIERGMRTASQYTWTKTAQQTLELYRKITQ